MGKKSPSKVTNTTVNTPPPQVLAQYEALTNRATGVANTPYTPYTGQLVAGLNDQQNMAIGNINAAAGVGTPYLNQASQYGNQSAQGITPMQFSGDAVAQYMNPYQQYAIDAARQNMQENNAQQRQQLIGNSIAKGAWGGDRAGIAQAELARQQGLSDNATIAGMYQQGYTQALGQFNQQQQTQLGAEQNNAARQANAAFLMGNLGQQAQQQALTGASAQLQAGTLQQQNQQEQLSSAYNQFLNQQAYPFQTTGWLGNIVTGVGNASGGTSTATAPGPSKASQNLGLLTGGIGLLGALGGLKRGGAVKGYADGGNVGNPMGDMSSGVEDLPPYTDYGAQGGDAQRFRPFHPQPLLAQPPGMAGPTIRDFVANEIFKSMAQRMPDTTNHEDLAAYANMMANRIVADPNSLANMAETMRGPSRGVLADEPQQNPGFGDAARRVIGDVMDARVNDNTYGATNARNHASFGGWGDRVGKYTYTGQQDNLNRAPYGPSYDDGYASGGGVDPNEGLGGQGGGVGVPFIPYTGQAKMVVPPTANVPGMPHGGMGIPVAKTPDTQSQTTNGSDQLGLLAKQVGKLPAGGISSLFQPGSATGKLYANGGGVRIPFSYGGDAPDSIDDTGLPPQGVQVASADSFAPSLSRVFQFEGGLNPRDTNGTPSKYGINQAANPDLDVANINREQAAKVYRDRYWNTINGDKLPAPLAHVAFDTSVIAGPGKANELLAYSGGDPGKYLEQRAAFQRQLLASNPAKYGPYANAWQNRLDTLKSDVGANGANTDLGWKGTSPVRYISPQDLGNTPVPQAAVSIPNDPKDKWLALAAAGFGIAGGTSPFMGVNIGQGMQQGLKTYMDLHQQHREDAKAMNAMGYQQGELGVRGRTADLEAQRLAQDAYQQKTRLGIEQQNADTAKTGMELQRQIGRAGVQQRVYDPIGEIGPDGQLHPGYRTYDPISGKTTFAPMDGSSAAGPAAPARPVPPTGAPQGPQAPVGPNGETAQPQPQPPASQDVLRGWQPKVDVNPAELSPQALQRHYAIINNPEARKEQSQIGAKQLEAERTTAASANTALFRLDQMDHQYANLPKQGMLSPGAFMTERADVAKSINSMLHVFGGQDLFDPSAVASNEELVKDRFRLGAELSRQIGGREPGFIVQQAVTANPGGDNTPMGYRRIVAGLREAAHYQQDHAAFLDNYYSKFGHLAGAEEEFRRLNPPAKYSARAILSTIDSGPRNFLLQHPNTAADFDKKYGPGTSALILGGQ